MAYGIRHEHSLACVHGTTLVLAGVHGVAWQALQEAEARMAAMAAELERALADAKAKAAEAKALADAKVAAEEARLQDQKTRDAKGIA